MIEVVSLVEKVRSLWHLDLLSDPTELVYETRDMISTRDSESDLYYLTVNGLSQWLRFFFSPFQFALSMEHETIY